MEKFHCFWDSFIISLDPTGWITLSNTRISEMHGDVVDEWDEIPRGSACGFPVLHKRYFRSSRDDLIIGTLKLRKLKSKLETGTESWLVKEWDADVGGFEFLQRNVYILYVNCTNMYKHIV